MPNRYSFLYPFVRRCVARTRRRIQISVVTRGARQAANTAHDFELGVRGETKRATRKRNQAGNKSFLFMAVIAGQTNEESVAFDS